MDYTRHYELLIERARNRILDGYGEFHHVTPRCMGGNDESDNLVKLTPEEHFLAHQLLVKMYPAVPTLIWAATMMCAGNFTHGHTRQTNKLFGWLRRRSSALAKQRTGDKNGMTGLSWYHDPVSRENFLHKPNEVPTGLIKGRFKVVKVKEESRCRTCNQKTGNDRRKYCLAHISEIRAQNGKKGGAANADKIKNCPEAKEQIMKNLAAGRNVGIKRPREKNIGT